jgi:hypothetical protein
VILLGVQKMPNTCFKRMTGVIAFYIAQPLPSLTVSLLVTIAGREANPAKSIEIDSYVSRYA